MKITFSHNRYLSCWTFWGLGHHKTIALYDSTSHILEVIDVKLLPKVLDVLRDEGILKTPLRVMYW